jgi:hypothetical protein
LILFLIVDVKYFLLSDDDDLKKDAAIAPLFDALTTPKVVLKGRLRWLNHQQSLLRKVPLLVLPSV